MFKAINALTSAFVTFINILVGLINIGGSAVTDAQKEYDDWSSRRTETKSNLKDFYQNFDTIQELTDKLQEVEQLDVEDKVKSVLRAELNAQLEQFITAK